MCCIENIIIPYDISGRFMHQLVFFLQGLESNIFFSAHDTTINAKSIIGVLSLGLFKGDSVQISVINDNSDTLNMEIKKIISYIRQGVMVDG